MPFAETVYGRSERSTLYVQCGYYCCVCVCVCVCARACVRACGKIKCMLSNRTELVFVRRETDRLWTSGLLVKLAATLVMKWIVVVLSVVAVAVAPTTIGKVRPNLAGTEDSLIWTSWNGETIVCGDGGQRGSSRPAETTVEFQLSTMIAAVCHYLHDWTARSLSTSSELRIANQQADNNDVADGSTSHEAVRHSSP